MSPVPPLQVGLVRLDEGLAPPGQAHEGDAGLDLRARVGSTLSASTGPQSVPTGVSVEIPPGYVALVCPRSGLAADHGVSVLNAPGVIDSGFRGEIVVVLFSVLAEPYTVERGDRIAQLVVVPSPPVRVRLAAALAQSSRGAAGFGSSGR